MAESNPNNHNLEKIRDILAKDVDYWNEKRWRIFSWSSSLLIGSIAGATIITDQNLSSIGRILLLIAVAVLTAYSFFWLRFALTRRDHFRQGLRKVDQELGVQNFVRPESSLPFIINLISYEHTVVALGILAMIMILLPCLPGNRYC